MRVKNKHNNDERFSGNEAIILKKAFLNTSIHPSIQPILRIHSVTLNARYKRNTKLNKTLFLTSRNFQALSGH